MLFSSKQMLFYILFFCWITTAQCHELIRLGSKYGGWTIPKDLITEDSICYSAGIGEDITFDIELIREYGCRVYCIDPTPRAIDHVTRLKNSLFTGEEVITKPAELVYKANEFILEKLNLIPLGLWNEEKMMKFYVPKNPDHVSHSIVNLQKTKDFFEAPCVRLSFLMRELGHTHIDLLKLDIEGAEGKVIDSILEEGIEVKCLCVEFDEIKDGAEETKKKIMRRIASLKKAGYRILYQRGFTEILFLKK